MATVDKNDTMSKVVEIIAQKINRDKESITQQTTLQDLGADSLDMVEIIMRLEEVFGIEINDEDAENMRTVADVVEYVHKKRSK